MKQQQLLISIIISFFILISFLRSIIRTKKHRKVAIKEKVAVKETKHQDISKSAGIKIATKSHLIKPDESEYIIFEKDEDWLEKTTDFLLSQSSVIDLLQVKNVFKIGYKDLLSCFEWQYKRLRILIRDEYSCQDCKKRNTDLQVHHTLYLKDRLPWEIEDRDLISLCDICHKNRHDNEKIKVYEVDFGNKYLITNMNVFCSRCCGTGFLGEYKHVQNGICFKCNGNRITSSIFSARLKEIKEDMGIYDFNKTYDETWEFIKHIRKFQNKTTIKISKSAYRNFNSWERRNYDFPF